MALANSIISLRHPQYAYDELYWWEWRECYEGGDYYLQRNLVQFDRELDSEFIKRRQITPIPTFSASAVNDIRNSVFHRMVDVTRRGGSDAYAEAVAGNNGGIDNKGTSMQTFMGVDVLTELLVMGRAGIYVDSPVVAGDTLADVQGVRPYVYTYKAEDILSWSISKPEEPGDFKAVLLRDHGLDFERELTQGIELPKGTFTRYRLVWINPDTGKVNLRFYDKDGNPSDKNSFPSDEIIELDLTQIPFDMPDIGGSLLKDVYKHQKALLNLGSSDVSYALKANFPFLVEQQDLRAVGDHLKQYISDDGSTGTTRNEKPGKEYKVGTRAGRKYDVKAKHAPQFIHPSPEPLLASIKLQEKLEDDIRKLVNLAVQNKVGQKAMSAEALKLSDQGIESGLTFIGLALESSERKVAQYWAAYEEKNKAKRQVAVIKYPDRYTLKTDKDRIDEATELVKLMQSMPGRTVKQEIAKTAVTALLQGRVSVKEMEKIMVEVEKASYTTSSPDVILQSVEAGLCGEETGSLALGFKEGEHLKAREDHAARAVRILQAQTSAREEAGQARGVPDLGVDQKEGQGERAEATDTTLEADKKEPVRGAGKNIEKGN